MRKGGLLLIVACTMMAGMLAGCGSSNERVANTLRAIQIKTVNEPEIVSDAGKSHNQKKSVWKKIIQARVAQKK